MKYLILSLVFWIISFSQISAQNLEPQDFKQKFIGTSDAILLDVRTPAETFFGGIELSKNIYQINYYASDFEEQLQKLDKNKTYFIYCRTGIRSQKAFKIMQKQGFKKLVNLKGGYQAWTDRNDK